jgi:PBSX family phage terminase large subunit
MQGIGEYSKADAVFEIHGGGKVYCRTATDPDSIVGITNVRHVWVDEAGLISLYAWENVQARAAFKSATIDLTSSPYTLNWLFKEIVRPKQKDPKALPHVKLVQASSWENPHMPREVIDRARITMDPRRFNAMFGGQWERMAGLVYDCFDEVENQCDAFTLPAGTRYVGGIDWGYTEPFVFKVRAITPSGHHFGVHEFYKSGLTINDMVAAVKRLNTIYNIEIVYCGPDQPGYIEEMNRNGIKALGANNDVRVGIDRHYALLKTRQLKYFRGENPYTLDEIDTYHYPAPDDLKPDEAAKDQKPVFQNDHALDADRYISIMEYVGNGRNRAFVPQDKTRKTLDVHAEAKRLMRGPKTHQTEEW